MVVTDYSIRPPPVAGLLTAYCRQEDDYYMKHEVKAGAIAVGAGSALVSKALMSAKDYAQITENAQKFCQIVREARG